MRKSTKLKIFRRKKRSVILSVLKRHSLRQHTSDIKREILLFYLKMLGKRRKEIADKILAKMGRKNLKVWMNL